MLHELVLLLLWHAQTDKSCFPAWQQALKTLGKRETDIRAMVYPSVSRVCVCVHARRACVSGRVPCRACSLQNGEPKGSVCLSTCTCAMAHAGSGHGLMLQLSLIHI